MEILKTDIFESGKTICQVLQDNGFQAVFAGGAVRDMLLGREPHDIDIATSAKAEQVQELFPHTLGIGKAFGVVSVVEATGAFEVATFRQDVNCDGRKPEEVVLTSMEEDAKRRDFTMNGLFFDPITEEVIDFVGGKEDIANKVIRFIGDPQERIAEDQLRILRAIRFSSVLEFEIESSSLEAIRQHAMLAMLSERVPVMLTVSPLEKVSSERIKAELDKMLLSEKPSIAFMLLARTLLLQYVLPCLHALITAKHSHIWHSEGSPFIHSLITVNKVREKTDDLDTLWAGLLHDVGKAKAQQEKNGVWKNHGHEAMGGPIVREALTKLKASNSQIDKVEFIVANHMRVKRANEMSMAKLKKLKANKHIDSLIIVSKSDDESSIPIDDEHVITSEWVDALNKVVLTEENKLPAPLINGHDLIAIGLKPGPIFRDLLEKVQEAQLEELISTKEEGLNFARLLSDNYILLNKLKNMNVAKMKEVVNWGKRCIVHYVPYDGPSGETYEPEYISDRTLCGCTNPHIVGAGTNNWNEVTCKRCLRRCNSKK